MANKILQIQGEPGISYDYLVIGLYFVLILSIGAAFARMAENSTSDYFRGGGRMLWWMVGSTAFMAQFSAVTFTGASPHGPDC